MEVSPHPAGEEHCPEDNRCAGGGGGGAGTWERLQGAACVDLGTTL